MGSNDHVTYHIWKYPKKGILMAYVSNHRKWFGMGFLKKEILMDYVSRSCNPPKMKIGGGVDAYVSRLCNLPKKEIFNGLHKHFLGAFSEKLPKKEI